MQEDKHVALHENFLLFLLAAVGIFLIVGGHFLHSKVPHAIATTMGGLGEAFFIAGALGVIVDKGLKRSLTRDAISYWVGWEVPASLREAVKDILRLPYVRHDFCIEYTLERCYKVEGFVRLTSVTQFCVENMTPKPQTYDFQSRVEPSMFNAVNTAGLANATLEMSVADQAFGPFVDVMVAPQARGGSLIRLRPVNLPPRGKQWFRTRREQYFPDSFFAILDFLPPACEGAKVIITPNPAFIFQVRFGADPDPGPERSREPGDGTWRHDGVLLPGQHVRIQWTPRR